MLTAAHCSSQVSRRMQHSGCLAVMTGRGALIKPWLFWEHKNGRELAPSALERVEIYRRLVTYMKEHFGDDAKGRQKAWSFLPWHFDFLTRYRSATRHLGMRESLTSHFCLPK